MTWLMKLEMPVMIVKEFMFERIVFCFFLWIYDGLEFVFN